MRFALKGGSIKDVESHLHEISHPKSANCDSEDVVCVLAPSDETVDIVPGWLIVSGIAEEVVTIGHSKGESK